MTYVMMTLPRKYQRSGRKWIEYFKSIDCHKWIVALEHGKGGLEHWQVRFKVRGCDTKEGKMKFFEQWKAMCNEVHIEFTENWCDYERKEGFFVCSDDNKEILETRYAPLLPLQREIIQTAESQSNREIDVWLDTRGNHGKSFLSVAMYERGLALVVPRYCFTARGISQFICSSYSGQHFIIFDVPRAAKIPPDIYEAIEAVKDGLVHDERYSGKCRNVRGAKIIIFTNIKLNTKKLSADRWRLHGISDKTGMSLP